MFSIHLYGGNPPSDMLVWFVTELDYTSLKESNVVRFYLLPYLAYVRLVAPHSTRKHYFLAGNSYRSIAQFEANPQGYYDFELMIAQDVICVLERHGVLHIEFEPNPIFGFRNKLH